MTLERLKRLRDICLVLNQQLDAIVTAIEASGMAQHRDEAVVIVKRGLSAFARTFRSYELKQKRQAMKELIDKIDSEEL